MFSFSIFAQNTQDNDEEAFGRQVFLPSIEIGYIHNNTENLTGGILTKTSIEYRVRNNNDIFIRASYDTYSSDFTLTPENNLTNVIKGTASFTDVLIGGGYRFGDNKWRTFIMVQAGQKYYNYPEFVQNNNTINIEQGRRGVFSTRATLGFEYYFTEKSAVSFDFLQSQVWKTQDFWEDSGSAIGFSIGFITSLF
jgi:hypothetical protein